MAECLFCEISSGERAAEVVGSTDDVLAFRDVRPAAPTHVLLVPKKHLESAAELGEEQADLLGQLFGLANEVARSEGLSGWRLVTNVGPEGGQAIMHLHFHLLGGRELGWPPG